MKQKLAIQTTDDFYINAAGNLRQQQPGESVPHSLCGIQRVRINNIERLTVIGMCTGMEPAAYDEAMTELAVEWLYRYLRPASQTAGSDTEDDVYRLLQLPQVWGWWRNHHYIRDRNMLSVLCGNYANQLSTARNHLKMDGPEARAFAQPHTCSRYITLHRMCLKKACYQYLQLEDSYAQLNLL